MRSAVFGRRHVRAPSCIFHIDSPAPGKRATGCGVTPEEALTGAARYAGKLLSDQQELIEQGEFLVTARGESQREVFPIRVDIQRPA